jgi:hypothetical protein
MATSYSPKIITDGLVLCLDAGDSKSYGGSGSTWIDRSGNGNNGTLVNSPAFSNGGLDLDGTDDRITFDTPFADESDLTVIMWFKGQAASGAANGFGYLLHNNGSDTSTGNSYITIGEHGVNNQYYAALNGQYANMTFGVTTDTTTVHQIALTWDGSTQKVYFDGEYKKGRSLVNSKTLSSTTSIGSYRTSNYRSWDGAVYSCHIYNRALTASEILQNYNATKGRFGL